jgi:hypothetical protein
MCAQEAMVWLERHFIYTEQQVAALKAHAAAEVSAVEQGTAKPDQVSRKWRHRLGLNLRGKC